MDLVPLLQPPQNADGVFYHRLIDQHGANLDGFVEDQRHQVDARGEVEGGAGAQRRIGVQAQDLGLERREVRGLRGGGGVAENFDAGRVAGLEQRRDRGEEAVPRDLPSSIDPSPDRPLRGGNTGGGSCGSPEPESNGASLIGLSCGKERMSNIREGVGGSATLP